MRLRWVLTAAVLSGAAALLLIVPTTPPDDLRVKGGDFALEVFAKDADRPREVGDGDVVHPGERLGFRIQGDGGYVLIMGVDDRADAYPCYPPHGAAQWFDASDEPVVVDENWG